LVTFVMQDRGMPDEGGDPACWLPQVCEQCGQVVEDPTDHRCVRAVGLERVVPPPGPDGVIWALGGERQLEVNLVVLGASGVIGEHLNEAVDVAMVVLDGSAHVTVDGLARPVATHDLVFVPRGTRRGVTAGAGGVRYLTVHVARPGPTIRS
jgi:quercetin dioxygenase-like cupin family protein